MENTIVSWGIYGFLTILATWRLVTTKNLRLAWMEIKGPSLLWSISVVFFSVFFLVSLALGVLFFPFFRVFPTDICTNEDQSTWIYNNVFRFFCEGSLPFNNSSYLAWIAVLLAVLIGILVLQKFYSRFIQFLWDKKLMKRKDKDNWVANPNFIRMSDFCYRLSDLHVFYMLPGAVILFVGLFGYYDTWSLWLFFGVSWIINAILDWYDRKVVPFWMKVFMPEFSDESEIHWEGFIQNFLISLSREKYVWKKKDLFKKIDGLEGMPERYRQKIKEGLSNLKYPNNLPIFAIKSEREIITNLELRAMDFLMAATFYGIFRKLISKEEIRISDVHVLLGVDAAEAEPFFFRLAKVTMAVLGNPLSDDKIEKIQKEKILPHFQKHLEKNDNTRMSIATIAGDEGAFYSKIQDKGYDRIPEGITNENRLDMAQKLLENFNLPSDEELEDYTKGGYIFSRKAVRILEYLDYWKSMEFGSQEKEGTE